MFMRQNYKTIPNSQLLIILIVTCRVSIALLLGRSTACHTGWELA